MCPYECMPHVCRRLSKPKGVRSLELALLAVECQGLNSASATNALTLWAISPSALDALLMFCIQCCAGLLKALLALYNDVPSLFIAYISQPFSVYFRSAQLLFSLTITSDSETVSAGFRILHTSISRSLVLLSCSLPHKPASPLNTSAVPYTRFSNGNGVLYTRLTRLFPPSLGSFYPVFFLVPASSPTWSKPLQALSSTQMFMWVCQEVSSRNST